MQIHFAAEGSNNHDSKADGMVSFKARVKNIGFSGPGH
jgi:hypothetical protein